MNGGRFYLSIQSRPFVKHKNEVDDDTLDRRFQGETHGEQINTFPWKILNQA
jgi:hypothetical protein